MQVVALDSSHPGPDSPARNGDHRRAIDVQSERRRALIDAVWAPIPWMLEAMFVLLLALGDGIGMIAVAALLGLNVACGLIWDGCGRPSAPHNSTGPSRRVTW